MRKTTFNFDQNGISFKQIYLHGQKFIITQKNKNTRRIEHIMQININNLWFFLWKMSSMIVDYVKNMTQALHFKHRKLKVKVNISKLYQTCNGHAVPKK